MFDAVGVGVISCKHSTHEFHGPVKITAVWAIGDSGPLVTV